MKIEKFESLVEEALAEIPEKFKKYIKNLAILVEERPPKKIFNFRDISPKSLILGLYHGVPFKHRGPYYGNLPPDVIVIYKEPIESVCRNEEEVQQKIKEVVFHEIGHYFGLSEEDLKLKEDEG